MTLVRHVAIAQLSYERTREGEFKLSAKLESPDIAHLARALVPKHFDLQPQRYAPHISIVRHENPALALWDAQSAQWNHEWCAFEYETHMYADRRYFWLRAYSKSFESLRIGLGLPTHSSWSRPPDGSNCFHITCGNTKHLDKFRFST